MQYSSAEEIQRFTDGLVEDVTPQRKPLFVLDMDGNILIGYNLAKGKTLPPTGDARRNIPSGSDIAALERQGIITPALFAEKPMDARLPAGLVERMNRLEAEGKPFEIAVLTSRSEADALEILRESGVKHPEKHTLVTDSGAVLRVQGNRQAVRELSAKESAFLHGMTDLVAEMEQQVDAALDSLGFAAQDRPRLALEAKGIASNVHFRSILGHYGQGDDYPLAQQLNHALEQTMQHYIADRSPVDAKGKPAFKLLHGPATLEIKLADIHKGHGLKAVMDAAEENDVHPSAVIFAGDDICTRDKNGIAHPGTDYYAFAAAENLARESGIPIRTIHTLHPESGDMASLTPDAGKAPDADMPQADITLPTPLALGDVIEKIASRSEQRAGEIDARAKARVGEPQARIR